MKKKILVTGASGFIGKSFVLYNSENYKCIQVKEKYSFNSWLENLSLLEKPDIILHAGANTDISGSLNNPYLIFKNNINSSLDIAEYCRVNKIKKLIYLNSYGYGKPSYFPINEKHKLEFHSAYTTSKYRSENIIFDYIDTKVTQVISLRMFNIYGFWQNKKFLIPNIISQALESTNIKVRDCRPKRDFLYIKDLLILLNKIIDVDEKSGIYNIGSGKSYSVIDIVKYLEEILNKKIKVFDEKKYRKNEILDCYADIKKIKMDFNWTPRYNLKEGLKDYIFLKNSS